MKIFILLFILGCGISAFAQPGPYFVPQPIGGSPNTRSTLRGVVKGDSGTVVRSVRDTATANLNARVRNEHGLQILVNDTLFIRDTINHRWIMFGKLQPTGPTGIFTGVDTIFTNGTQLCAIKNSVTTCYEIGGNGVDSFKVFGDTLFCIYSNHNPIGNCTIVGNGGVVVISPDTLIVNGDSACWRLNGVETCININNQASGFTGVALNIDSTQFYYYSSGVLTDSVSTLVTEVKSGDTCIIITRQTPTRVVWTLNPNCRGGGSGGSQTYQQTLTQGSTLTQSNIINNGTETVITVINGTRILPIRISFSILVFQFFTGQP